MRIYTRTGDDGETGLFGGPRVPKDDLRIEAYGTVDELNAFLGQARTHSLPGAIEKTLADAQNDLFALGAELATPSPGKHQTSLVSESLVRGLETAIDELELALPPLREFILPAGTAGACALHVARGVCRRAERRVVSLARAEAGAISPQIIQYLNRLSDYLFVAARVANAAQSLRDVPWRKA